MRIVIDDGHRPLTGRQLAQGVAVLAGVLGLSLLAQAAAGPGAADNEPVRTWTVSTATAGPVMGWDTRCVPAVPPPGVCPDPVAASTPRLLVTP